MGGDLRRSNMQEAIKHSDVEEPTEAQEYVLNTMMAWALDQDFTFKGFNNDGTVEDTDGNLHHSPVTEVPKEDGVQLLVLADDSGRFDKIVFSPDGTAEGEFLLSKLLPMEGVNLEAELEEHGFETTEIEA